MRHSKRGVPVLRGVEQPHVDQLGARRTHLRRLAPDDGGHVLRLMGLWAELGHRAQVDALHLGGTVESHTKERLVELRLVGRDGQSDVLPGDRRSVRDAPYGVTDLLEEIRVAAGDLDRQVEGLVAEVSALVLGGLDQRGARVLVVEFADPREPEQPVRIGLRVPGQLGDLPPWPVV